MSLVKNAGLQVQEYVYDFAVDGGAVGTIDLSAKAGYAALPEGSIVTNVLAKVETAVTTGAGGTLAFGNGDDDDGFMAAIGAGSLTANAVFNAAGQDSALLWDGTNDHMIPLYIDDATTGAVQAKVETGALTAGKVRVLVFYVGPGRDS